MRSNSGRPSEDTFKLRLVGSGGIAALVGGLLGDLAALPARWCEVLKHGRQVGGQHALEVRGHGVGPEEVVVQGVITVDALGGIQHQQLVDEVQCVGVTHIGLQPVLHLPLLALDQVQFLKELVLVHIWPHLGWEAWKRECSQFRGYVAGPPVKHLKGLNILRSEAPRRPLEGKLDPSKVKAAGTTYLANTKYGAL